MEEDIQNRMQKTLSALRAEWAKMRTGRAHPGLLDGVMVQCYGVGMLLPQTATVTSADAQTLLVSPWDANNTAAIEKALRDSDLGLNPAATAGGIRVALPPLSEERRREMAKAVGRDAETAKVAMRNIRRDAVSEVKAKVKTGEFSEDEGRRTEQQIQKTTDASVGEVDSMANGKKRELMTV
ncbi:MAG: ribosome recycling factor [Betaproteobacteria bacterium]|nr:ribosome recycling factor [Betaproteobacteria bacterium]